LVVDRNKRPALTSPWKIGFLVSLFLVTVSIGVGFVITRTFGFTWTWIQFGDGSWALDSWAFDRNAFLNEMLPLIVLVPVMSLLAYLLITGAVRKYKAYLDSGLDYKHLVQSIQKIDDLQDDRIKALGGYPELRDFLFKIKNGISEQEKSLQEKETALNSRGQKISSSDEIKAETGVLVGAINRGPVDGFSEELALALPELKQIENAIRQHLLGVQTGAPSMSAPDLGEQMANLREELAESSEALKQMMTEISEEMVATQNGAREIEFLLGQVKNTIRSEAAGTATGAQVETANAAALVERLDQTSEALAALGEETKSVAINTALQAGGADGEVSELVKLADDVRELATKFNGVAAQYQEVGLQLRSAAQSLPESTGSDQVDEMIETMSGKVTFWIERAVILGEKLNALEQHFIETNTAFESKLGGVQEEDEAYQAVDDLASDSRSGEIDDQKEAMPADEFVHQQVNDPVLETETAHPTGLSGLEQNKNLFEEIGGQTEDNLFADIPPGTAPEQQSEQLSADEAVPPAEPEIGQEPPQAPPGEDRSTELFEEMGATEAQPAESLVAPQSQSRTQPGEFVQSQVDLSGVEVEETTLPEVGETAAETQQVDSPVEVESPGSETPPPSQPSPPGAPVEPAMEDSPTVAGSGDAATVADVESIYDLYELGAVDYEPSIHQNA
jgi:hypothetical protein